MKQNRRHLRSALFLMEITMTLLVLGICGGICANLFIKADKLSLESQALSQAVILAENKGEELKGDRERPERLPEPGASQIFFDRRGREAENPQKDGYVLKIQSNRTDGLYTAVLTVEWNEKNLCQIPVCVALSHSKQAHGEKRGGDR